MSMNENYKRKAGDARRLESLFENNITAVAEFSDMEDILP